MTNSYHPDGASDASESPIAQLFEQSVVEGSARYWAAHFTNDAHRTAVQAALCFAHLMDQLTAVSPEVIAEKSVWWHEELSGGSANTARHPVTRALLQGTEADVAPSDYADSMADAMHRHMHGALMSQQQTSIDTIDAWTQYAELRFGTLHELVALASGITAGDAAEVRSWTARLHGLGPVRAPDHPVDARVLRPSAHVVEELTPTLKETLRALRTTQPDMSAANRVLTHHELRWWKGAPRNASPVLTGQPVGLRGMLASWRAAR